MNKKFEKNILEASTEEELENAIINGPRGCMTDTKYWTDKMINKVSNMASISKEEFIDMIKYGRLLLLEENYDPKIIEQELNNL